MGFHGDVDLRSDLGQASVFASESFRWVGFLLCSDGGCTASRFQFNLCLLMHCTGHGM